MVIFFDGATAIDAIPLAAGTATLGSDTLAGGTAITALYTRRDECEPLPRVTRS
jgi:hypothetical protein